LTALPVSFPGDDLLRLSISGISEDFRTHRKPFPVEKGDVRGRKGYVRAEIASHSPSVSLKFLAAQGKSPGDGVFDASPRRNGFL